MALRWEWSDKMGKCKYKNGYESNLYRGNAYVISIYHYEENGEPYYQLNWFAASKDHMKNMLGLNKGFDNCFKDFGVEEIRLDVNYKETAELVQMFAKAKLEIKIELYKGESK